MKGEMRIVRKVDVKDIERDCIADGMLKVMPAEYYRQYDEDKLINFFKEHGIYVLPTVELVDYLRERISGTAIEICCGNGAVGRALNIPITDSKMQEDPEIIDYYNAHKQPTIVYPADVEKLNAIQAVHKYKPMTVIGCFATHKWEPGMEYGNMYGVDFGILHRKIKKLILVGNKQTHKGNPLLSKKHKETNFDWLITRSSDQRANRIFEWVN